MILVVDASVSISWLADYEPDAYAAAVPAIIGTDTARVPGLRQWEMANVLTVLERKGRLVDALLTYADMTRLPIEIESLDYRASSRAILEIELSRKHKLSVYDAAYLAQAKDLSLPLATLDVALVRAAKNEQLFFE